MYYGTLQPIRGMNRGKKTVAKQKLKWIYFIFAMQNRVNIDSKLGCVVQLEYGIVE